MNMLFSGSLLLLGVVWPLLLALLLAFRRMRPMVQHLAPWAAQPALLASLLVTPSEKRGHLPGRFHAVPGDAARVVNLQGHAHGAAAVEVPCGDGLQRGAITLTNHLFDSPYVVLAKSRRVRSGPDAGLVPAGRSDLIPVGTPGHGPHCIRVSLEHRPGSPVGIPQADGAVRAS